jgi:translation initiation factor IF-2
VQLRVHRLIHTFLKDFEETAINKKRLFIKGTERGRGVVANVYSIKAKKGDSEAMIPGIRVEAGKLGKAHRMYVFRNGSPATEGVFARSIKIFKKEMVEVKKG